MNQDRASISLMLVRHGQTIENTQNRCQGHTVGTLSPVGIEQAETLHEELQNEHFDVIFASDLSRAKHTARILFPEADIIEDSRLRERYYGALEGQILPPHLRFDGEIEGAESFDSLRARLVEFLAMIKREYAGQRIAIVSHGIVVKTVLSLCTGAAFDSVRIPKNCTPYYLEL